MLIHDEQLDDLGLVPRIKRFVQDSVPGLSEDHISISLFPFNQPPPQRTADEDPK
jgi:type III secretory pathway lipoprotein EscJ